MINNPKIIISALIEIEEKGVRKILLQTRWKLKTSPAYSGLLEIPAGGIEPYENVYSALEREIYEETGLQVVEIIDDCRSDIMENIPNEKTLVFKPFICQQMIETRDGLPWIGFVFRCRVKGELKPNPEEVKNPVWITIEELELMLKNQPKKFFPLQYSTLDYYVKFIKCNYKM